MADGIKLVRASDPWLKQRGHLGPPPEAGEARNALAKIFEALGGQLAEQAAKRPISLPGDFLHPTTGTYIEIDESQHFTSYRLLSLDTYPPDVPLGFDVDHYRDLCRQWSPISDKYRASKAAAGFGERGRQRQRAYHDALRDITTPALGRPPVIRVAAPDRDGRSAYERVRDRLRALT